MKVERRDRMEKYDVLDLYVVNVGNYYFICEKLIEENTYKEIFTNEEFIVSKHQKKEPLKNYYKLLVLKSYSTKVPLMPTKEELLLRYAQLNSEHVEIEKRHSSNLESVLSGIKEYRLTLMELAETNREHAMIEALEALRRTGVIDENDKLDAGPNLLCKKK